MVGGDSMNAIMPNIKHHRNNPYPVTKQIKALIDQLSIDQCLKPEEYQYILDHEE